MTIENRKIKVNDLNFYYGKTHALKDINIDIAEKKVTALIGPSGCGKSTLIRIFNRMCDLVPNTKAEGTILLGDENILLPSVDVVKLRCKVGMVFQKPNPFPKTIFQNIAYGLEINGNKNKDFIRFRVEESLKKAALWEDVKHRLNDSALALSGGQQQRLCIARALAVETEVILFDEPCASLDPISTSKIEELILELKKNYTIIIVTHNMQQASRISDYTAFMYLGNLIEFGLTDRVFTVPQNERTEAYLSGRFG
ncbi:phosphate ABC transporter ATP-binding protein PstB [Endomicrobium proavitum]|uniref:Phosphate transporter subunit n=1 Tax=Endomicrobium proavitum TaxID=1408281 RepID=A0A0G3WKI1_9BACT|nr:phosphate ABC transporter ATP-binding protein PstB [Endomicrobium proavitum]AKL98415.1 phosphate transporter subunit [Endomicrobium proavitum]